ncbi:MAG: BMP family ABC transporter substrate-binding protein [Nocardioidaceae bacterium]|nr:BMP family ABC transporter substrate-binding protein [Nocardioidaceae bacterium]
MRRTTKISAASMVAMLALAGCAGSEEDTGSGDSTEEGICETADGDGPKVGLAYDVGGVGDQSFNDSAYAGLTQVVEDVDGTCEEVEANAGESDADREERLRLLADGGFNPIIAVGFVYSPAVDVVAAEYPEVSFAVVDGYSEAKNAANLTFAANEGSFLVGVAAALKSEAKNVGFLGGVDGPLIQAFEAGYVAGVEAVDPNIKIQVQYLSQADPVDGFENPAGGKTASTGMYDNGADVIFHAAGKSGLGLFEAVVEAGEGNWAIGVDSDQYLTVDEEQKPYILTSMLKRIDTSVIEFVTAFDEGKAPTGFVTYDLASGGVDYSTSGGNIDDITDQIDEYKQKIIDGEIEVPTEPK